MYYPATWNIINVIHICRLDLEPSIVIIIFLLTVIIILLLLLLLFKRKLDKTGQEKSTWISRYKELEKRVSNDDGDKAQYKLNPHLFKNALNAIQSHAYQSYYALDKLSNVLDYILYESSQRYVPLSEEVEFTLSLIEINRLKTSPLFNLHVKNKIDKDDYFYTSGLIAPLITINPIENAFKHVNLQYEGAFISIVLEEKEGWFELSVSNSVTPEQGERELLKGGIGNAAFNKRLATIYGDQYRYQESVGNGIYTTYLRIKLFEDYA